MGRSASPETTATPRKRRLLWAAAIAAACLAPVTARTGLVEDEQSEGAQTGGKASPGYLLRCWQEGKLIIEERLQSLPPTVDLSAAKLKALDADRHAVYITETHNATCLLRALAPARPSVYGR